MSMQTLPATLNWWPRMQTVPWFESDRGNPSAKPKDRVAMMQSRCAIHDRS